MKNEKRILNLGAGKFNPIDLKEYSPYFLVNVDPMYFDFVETRVIESSERHWVKTQNEIFYSNDTAQTFMERTRIKFDHLVCYRFLEHISFTELEYFIYLMSNCLKIGGTCDIIVPNYETLCKMILEETKTRSFDTAKHILMTTELLNEPSCPHASIWTPFRVHHFFELEGRFEVTDLCESFNFDGRDIYIRFSVKRIK